MNCFPLNPFLASLATEGIRVTVRDYRRIALALRTDGPWTITRLRDTLLALLAKDENQQVSLLRRFNDFFELETGAEDAYADVDLEKALADLRQLAHMGPLIQRPKLDNIRKPVGLPIQKAIGKPKVKFTWWIVALIALILGILVTFGYIVELTSSPTLTLDQSELNFGGHLVGSTSIQQITLMNNGSRSVAINLEIIGPHSNDFDLTTDDVIQQISAGSNTSIGVSFSPGPDSVGDRYAFLDIAIGHTDSFHRVVLTGVGIIEESTLRPDRKRLYPDVPYIEDFQYGTPFILSNWKLYVALAVLFLFGSLLYGLYLWRSHRIPEDEPVYWDEEGPRHFPLGSIGGQPSPQLDDDTLNQLADCMGYFQSGQGGRMLNVPASIKASLRQGGMPALKFLKRRQIRALLILEDAFAGAIEWNSIARELTEGMRQRGVPVLFGQFNGSPGQFKTEDGAVYHLEDLEDQRRGYLVLVFSDGKGLYRHESTFALESLARWPLVAWMELGHQRFWDEISALPTRYGIPIFPATPAGTVEAMRSFLTERGLATDFSDFALNGRGIPGRAGTTIEAYVEQLLGDALIWAMDCAVLQPIVPISPGLADALRREFHPNLPYERMELLCALPGTTHSVSGLRFSEDVLKVLCSGFLVRRTEQEQEDVLRFLLREIQAVEPDEPDSLAHLAWETIKERVRLGLEPDDALVSLAQLARTPLGDAIRASLGNYGLHSQADKIPLRLEPRSKEALQRLARIADGFNIPKLDAYSPTLGHWLPFGLLIFLCLVCAAWGARTYFASQAYFRVTNEAPVTCVAAVNLEMLEEEAWQEAWPGPLNLELRPGVLSLLEPSPLLLSDRNYRWTVYAGGLRSTSVFSATSDTRLREITLNVVDVERLCREELPDIGLTVEHCPVLDGETDEVVQLTSWREKLGDKAPENRLISVGLEISANGQSDPALESWRNTLLQTSSIDVLYRIYPDQSGEWHIEQALEQLQLDLRPWIERGQLIWWEVGQVSDTVNVEDSLPVFGRAVKLGNGTDVTWIAVLEKLFEPGEDEIVTEKEIMDALDQRQGAVGSPVVLVRPTRPLSVLAAEPTRTPTLTATVPPFTKLRLLTPDQGAILAKGQDVKLEWEWDQDLAPDEFFQVRIRLEGEQEFDKMNRTKASYQFMPASKLTHVGTYEWQVAVVSLTEERSASQLGIFSINGSPLVSVPTEQPTEVGPLSTADVSTGVYQPPVLVSPPLNATIVGKELIEFSWKWDGDLQEEEEFNLLIWRREKPASSFAIGRECSVLIDTPPDGFGDYLWQVVLARTDKDGNKSILSESEKWPFTWSSVTPTYTPIRSDYPLTPTSLPTDTPTPANTATPDAVVVREGGLNLRSGPGVGYDIIGYLHNDDTLGVIGRTVDNEWLQVIAGDGPGLTGWISALPQYVQINVSLDSVPIAGIPPTLTPWITPAATPFFPAYPAPVLSHPDDGAAVQSEFPALFWQWDGELGEDEFFEVRIWHESLTTLHTAVGWVKIPQFDYNLKGSRSGKYYWTVVVVKGANAKPKDWTLEPWWPYPMWEGELVAELSPESIPRSFIYSLPANSN